MRVLITGASRGIGFEFARRYLEAGHTVFALARAPESSPLKDLVAKPSTRLVCVPCEVADDASVRHAREAVEKKTEALDLVLNNAGTFGPEDDRLEKVDFAQMRRVFEVNAFGPIRVSREFLPLLRSGAEPKLVHLTSLMGSVSDNRSGGRWSYRMSKAALNMASRNLALELARDGIISVVLHPGWVRTDMGGPSAPLKVEDAVLSMVQTIARLTPGASGSFLDRHGKPAPW